MNLLNGVIAISSAVVIYVTMQSLGWEIRNIDLSYLFMLIMIYLKLND